MKNTAHPMKSVDIVFVSCFCSETKYCCTREADDSTHQDIAQPYGKSKDTTQARSVPDGRCRTMDRLCFFSQKRKQQNCPRIVLRYGFQISFRDHRHSILTYQGVHCCTKVCNLQTVRVVIQPEC